MHLLLSDKVCQNMNNNGKWIISQGDLIKLQIQEKKTKMDKGKISISTLKVVKEDVFIDL